jgi:dihydroorotate dehydrogenase (NAD+) catalytic subunit
VALKVVYETAQVVSIPIVAIGGIVELRDVLDYFAVGAVAAQVGTAIFADPNVPVRLVDELTLECRRLGLASHHPMVGTALPPGSGSSAGRSSARGVEYRP